MPLAALSLVFGVGVAGLGSPYWAVRADSHAMLVECGGLARAFTASAVDRIDPETGWRAAEVVRGRLPRTMPCPLPAWEPWPKNRLR